MRRHPQIWHLAALSGVRRMSIMSRYRKLRPAPELSSRPWDTSFYVTTDRVADSANMNRKPNKCVERFYLKEFV